MNAPSSLSVAGLILAGGQARRMAGKDKGLLLYQQRPLVEHVLTRLQPQVEQLIISANRHLDQYQQYGYLVLTDNDNTFLGPLSGMVTALRQTEADFLLVAPCDTPLLAPCYRQRMMENLLAQRADLAVATDGQRWHPALCLLTKALLASLEDYLMQGGRKIETWLKRHKVAEVDFSDHPAMFININSPSDLDQSAPIDSPKPVLGFAAFSGTGKTTLLTQLLPLLKRRGLRVAVIKHAHHNFDIDKPGKDSYQIREAGAQQMLIASANMTAWIEKHDNAEYEPRLAELIQRLDKRYIDLILVEGFKHEQFAKIELHRPSLGKPLLCVEDTNIIAVASDSALENINDLPQLDINDTVAIADFVQLFMTNWKA